MIKTIFGAIYRFFRFLFISALFVSLLGAGMAAGGFFLLDYLIKGETVEVPRLYGLTKAQAIETLNKNELLPNLPVEEVVKEGVSPGIVIEQRPLPGSKVKKGRTINLTVSALSGEILVPNLVGQRQHEIAAELSASQLDPVFAEMHHPQIPQGVIISQSPLPGRRHVPKGQINILVSLGPKPMEFVMPNFVERPYTEVLREIQKMPFTISEERITYRQTANPMMWNRVLEQSPKPGEKIMADEAVSLVVAADSQVSGAPARIEWVSFENPFTLFPSRLALLVWDDVARQFGHPHVIPLNPAEFAETIEKEILVTGDAMVLLAVTEEQNGVTLPSGLLGFENIQLLGSRFF